MTGSPASSHGSTYTPPTARAIYFGNNVSINNGATGSLTWDSIQGGGTALLDLTAPGLPTFVTAGVYAVSVYVSAAANMTAAGAMEVELEIDTAGDDPTIVQVSGPATALEPRPFCALSLTYYSPAGGTIRLRLKNNDGVQNLNFLLQYGVVQRIS